MYKYLNPQKYSERIRKTIKSGTISYSQSGEDLILNIFFRSRRNGFYVDVGANHPSRLNNTYFFYKRGWTGINIEPDPRNFHKLQRARKRDINLNIGIGKNNGKLTFYAMAPSGLSTFSKDTAASYRNMGHKMKRERSIEIMPLSVVLEKHCSRSIDFLSIDTEGFDKEVLSSNDWTKFRPKFIIIETLKYKKEGFGEKLSYDEYFSRISYEKIADTYINSIYINLDNLEEFKVNANIIHIDEHED